MKEHAPNNFQGWLALAVFVQSSALFILMAIDHQLLDSQGFMTLASAVIVTGWVGAVIGFAFTAGKAAGEQNAAMNKALEIAAAAQPTPPVSAIQEGDTVTLEKRE